MVFNNHGWSIQQMILCCAILLVALFFVVFYGNQLMIAMGKDFNEKTKGDTAYTTIEKNISNAALSYMYDYYKKDVGTGTITILASNLLKRGILKESDLVVSDNDTCTGYALVRKNDKGNLEADAFINCNKYITKNYQYWRIGD